VASEERDDREQADTSRSAVAPRLTERLARGGMIAGRFRLERSLGEGGMGVVWQAVHVVTRKPVALKFLKRRDEDDSRAVQRFLREARAACAVRHPSVVEVNDVLELEDGSPVMVMELLAGETLAQKLSRERTLALPELARIMVHVCSAVGSAHALGIVHRDLKPENVFLAESPAGTQVKVLDFGIAKLTASDGAAANTGMTTGTGAILGTPYYMAPEQLFGEKDVDHRADLWALGVMFYEALCGQRPTQGDNVGQIYKVAATGTITPLREKAPHLPADVLDLVSRMLTRDRTQRPRDVREVLEVLSAYTNETFVQVDAARTPQPRESSSEAPPKVDSDAARASTIDAAVSAADAPRKASEPGRTGSTVRWRGAAAFGVVAAGAVALGVLALRGSSEEPAIKPLPAVVATTAPASLEGTVAPSAQPPPLQSGVAVAGSASVASPPASASSAPAPPARTAVRAQPTTKPTPAVAPTAAASKPPPQKVDPASYQ
jgi:serine/threonine protein kinase